MTVPAVWPKKLQIVNRLPDILVIKAIRIPLLLYDSQHDSESPLGRACPLSYLKRFKRAGFEYVSIVLPTRGAVSGKLPYAGFAIKRASLQPSGGESLWVDAALKMPSFCVIPSLVRYHSIETDDELTDERSSVELSLSP